MIALGLSLRRAALVDRSSHYSGTILSPSVGALSEETCSCYYAAVVHSSGAFSIPLLPLKHPQFPKYQHAVLVSASSFWCLEQYPYSTVYYRLLLSLSFPLFVLFSHLNLISAFSVGSTGWFSSFFSTSTPKVQRCSNLVDLAKC